MVSLRVYRVYSDRSAGNGVGGTESRTMGLGRNADKRGNTGGGSSTGRSGQKRGGRDYTADLFVAADHGILTCPSCIGAGEVFAPRQEVDADGPFDGADRTPCPRCGGVGTVAR